MTIITVNVPTKTAAPRGAAVVASWFVAFLGWLEAVADRRQQSRQLAGRVAEAAQMREYAQQVMALDARFAADLFAAADRHQRS